MTIATFVATVAQVLVATFFASELSRFEGKGFGARLIAYPVMMLAVPLAWAAVRSRPGTQPHCPGMASR